MLSHRTRTILLLIVTGGVLHAAPAAAQPAVAGAVVGRPVPACPLQSLAGAPGPDLAALRGQVIYVDFWASWCGPCAKAFPFLDRLDAGLRDRGLQVVAINVDERIADAQAFLQRHRAGFALARDASGACPRAFGVVGMPSSYLIDRRGMVRAVHVGFRESDAAQRRQEIERLLAEDAGLAAGADRPRDSAPAPR